MAIYKSDIVDINLETCNIHRAFLNRTIGSGDSWADHFGIRVFRNGEPVDLTGVSVQGIFLPPQGSPIAITDGNSVSGNEAYVVLPQACYNYDGQFCLSIKLVGGGVTGTMRIVDGMVDNTHSTGTVAPTETVPTYQEILSAYDDMVAATAAANGAIAKPYAQLTFPVKKGEYTIVEGALKRALVDIATSETYTAAHWTDAKLGPDLSQLKSALGGTESIINNEISELSKSEAITYTATESGGILNRDGTKHTDQYASYAKISVVPGEQYSIDFKGHPNRYVQSALVFYQDENGNYVTLGIPYDYADVNDPIMQIVPGNSAFMVVNYYNSYKPDIKKYSYVLDKSLSIDNAIAEAKTTGEIRNNLESMVGTKYTYDIISGERVWVTGDTGEANPGDFVEVEGYVRTDYIDVEYVDSLVFTHDGNRSSTHNAWYDKDKHYLGQFGFQWQGTRTVAPILNAKYAVVSWYEQDSLDIKINYKGIYPWLKETNDTVDRVKYIKGNASGNVIILENSVSGTPLTVESALPTNKKYYICSKNLVHSEYEGETINGVTCTNNGDGTFTVNGTATGGNAQFVLDRPRLPNGTCKLTGCPAGGGASAYRLAFYGYGGDDGNGKDITVSANTYGNDLSIIVYEGTTVSNLLFKPMIIVGNTFEDFVVGVERQEVTVNQIIDKTKVLESVGNGTVIFNDNNLTMTVEYDKYDVAGEVEKMISATDTEDSGVPAYYDTHLATKIATLQGLNEKIGSNGLRFLFITDYHDFYNNANRSPDLIRKISGMIPIPMCVFGGDGPNMAADIPAMRTRLVDFLHRFDGIDNFYPIIGNHEFYSNWSNPGDYKGGITASEVYYYFYKNIEQKMDGGDATKAYYIDNKVQKVRVYFVGCDYYYQITSETKAWILDSFRDIPSGYRVIVIAHAAMKANGTELYDSFVGVHNGMVAVNNHTTYEYGGVVYDYTGVNAKIPFVLCGHTHVDKTNDFNGIRYVSTTTDNWTLGKVQGENRDIGTVTEQAFDVVSVSFDPLDPKVYLTRIGYGNDRTYALTI